MGPGEPGSLTNTVAGSPAALRVSQAQWGKSKKKYIYESGLFIHLISKNGCLAAVIFLYLLFSFFLTF